MARKRQEPKVEVPDDRPEIQCDVCAKKRKTNTTKAGNLRPPNKWKLIKGQLHCQDCVKKNFELRAIAFPVDGVLDEGDWGTFENVMLDAWRQATDLANWIKHELLKRDVIPVQGQDFQTWVKQGPNINDVYSWYLRAPYIGKAWWENGSSSANAVMRTAGKKYNKTRVEVLWRGDRKSATERYPTPFPVHVDTWRREFRMLENPADPSGELRETACVNVPIAGTRWTLKLRSSPYAMRKQLKAFRQLLDGDAEPGELSIYRKRVSNGCHRRTVSEKKPGGGNRIQYRVMVKIVGYFPRRLGEREQNGVMQVRTGHRAFLVAAMEGDERPWTLCNDQVRGWIKEHRRFLQEISEDLKAERRPRGQRIGEQEKIETKCHRYDNRIANFVQTAAAWVVNYASRRGVAELEYDDRRRSYFPQWTEGQSGFNYAALRDQIERKCVNAGIHFIERQEPETPDQPEEAGDNSAENAIDESE